MKEGKGSVFWARCRNDLMAFLSNQNWKPHCSRIREGVQLMLLEAYDYSKTCQSQASSLPKCQDFNVRQNFPLSIRIPGGLLSQISGCLHKQLFFLRQLQGTRKSSPKRYDDFPHVQKETTPARVTCESQTGEGDPPILQQDAAGGSDRSGKGNYCALTEGTCAWWRAHFTEKVCSWFPSCWCTLTGKHLRLLH